MTKENKTLQQVKDAARAVRELAKSLDEHAKFLDQYSAPEEWEDYDPDTGFGCHGCECCDERKCAVYAWCDDWGPLCEACAEGKYEKRVEEFKAEVNSVVELLNAL